MLAVLLTLALPPAPDSASRFRSSDPYTPSHTALVAAEGARRPVEGRLSGGFAFAPWDEGFLDGESEPTADDLATEAAIEAASGADPNASTRAARAVLEIRRGRPDKAIALLASAVEERPGDPRLLSDLAAAYLARHRNASDPRSLIHALTAAERALALDPGLPEAGFNRALALERLHLTDGATAAWEVLVDVEPTSGWAEEARQRLARLRAIPSAEERWRLDHAELERAVAADDHEAVRSLVDRHRQSVRLWIDDELLPEWGAKTLRGEHRAAASIQATARSLAQVLAALSGDQLTADAVAAVARAAERERSRLASGHLAYGRARRLHEEQRYEEAGPLFRAAAAELEAAGSPFSAWARLYLAIHLYHEPSLPAAFVELSEANRSTETDRYPILAGHVSWMLALVHGSWGPLASALPHWQEARRRFAQTGETENRAAVDSSMGLVLSELGDYDRAWRHHLAALTARTALRKPRRIQNLFFDGVFSLRRSGDLLPALDFADELAIEAREAGNPVGLTIALRQRGELLADLGRLEDALETLDQAERHVLEIPDEGLRTVSRGELLIARGRMGCSLDPRAGVSDLTDAARFVERTQHAHLVIDVLRERARCHLARGDEEAAEEDLRSGLVELERQRALLRDPELRRRYLDQARGLLEDTVRLQVEGGQVTASFATVERLRAPELAEALAASSPDPGRISESLPSGTAIVEFLVLDKEVIAWIVGARSAEVVRIPISRGDLTEQIESLRASLDRREPHQGLLDTVLWGRLLPYLADFTSLVLVPDGPLHSLPFAALRDPAGRFAVERFSLVSAPSARVYTALMESADRYRGSRPASVLAVGNVPAAAAFQSDLPALPGSEREARSLAGFYPDATLLLGPAATPARFLAEVPRHDVVHVAAHGLEFPDAPELASLLLAPSANGPADGLLAARDVRFSRSLRTRLVVLAACRSVGGSVSASEGPLSLARSFLAAGVPAVVGSLWDLDEFSSLEFFLRFHAAHAAGSDPLTAFRETQLALLHHSDPRLSSPRSWAGLVLLGGSVDLTTSNHERSPS